MGNHILNLLGSYQLKKPNKLLHRKINSLVLVVFR